MTESSSAQLVSEFAASLDAEDYARTRVCLAENCIYQSPDGELTGPDAILASYRGNGDKAQQLFDSVKYEHHVTPLDGSWFQILFIDRLSAGKLSHEFRCHQRVRVEENLIAEIVHQEIPGKRDELNLVLDRIPER